MSVLPEIWIGSNGTKTLIRKDLDETYHSQHGAIQESLHVFIEAGLLHHIRQNQNTNLDILEVGFGSGLNAMLSLWEAEKHQLNINYHALETVPLPYALIQQLDYDSYWGKEKESLFQEIHTADWNTDQPITSHFQIKKIAHSLQEFHPEVNYDVVYFDAFAPDKQAELWQLEMLQKLFSCMNPKGIFVTYSSKGEVKRNLQSAGFKVEKIAGAAGKRHMLRAIKQMNHE